MKGLLFLLSCLIAGSFFIFLSTTTIAQTPFTKGVNLTNWFQTTNARQIQFSKYTHTDFQHIKSLGCDVIRLPINLHSMTTGTPDYTVDPLFFNFLDQAVDWAEELHINLILDNHSFDPAAATDPGIGTVLVKVWTQMAHHFKGRSKYIFYEILNEPHGIDDATWAPIQQSAIDAIRTEDTNHFIVVGAANWNSYSSLNNLPVYTDTKLIYTFHFYDPFVFTHQGASWVDPSMVPLAGVPFPYKASAMPAVPAALKGTWVEGGLNDYVNTGTVAKVKSLIDIAVAFKTQRNVPVYCGEFGVYIPNSNNTDRVAWYQVVRSYLEEKGIPWTTWDYQGGFGLFKKDSNELFDYDINVPLVQALGFTVPTQLPYQKKPRTTGYILYDDYVGENISSYSSTSSGVLDYYSTNAPHAGSYCIDWANVGQYDPIGFDFIQDIDMSLLKDQDTLQFWVRGNAPGTKFDMRFIDTKTGVDDHPWRMGKTFDNTFAPWDGSWYHVQVPLKNLEEKGSWDDAWFDPQGKFDWSAVDKFEIVPEQQPLDGIQFSFDDIRVSGKDVVIIAGLPETVASASLKAYPNPVTDHLEIAYQLQNSGSVKLEIFTLQGQKIKSLVNEVLRAGLHTIQWEGKDDNNQKIAEGLYIIRLEAGSGSGTIKISKI